jgi:hypothetical protein
LAAVKSRVEAGRITCQEGGRDRVNSIRLTVSGLHPILPITSTYVISDDYFFGDEDFDISFFIVGLAASESGKTHYNVRYSQQTAYSAAPLALAPRPIFRPLSHPVPTPAPSISHPKSLLAGVIAISDDDGCELDDLSDLENANWDEFDQQLVPAWTSNV